MPPTKPTKKRILHKLKIDEISAVDAPAQQHARMVIMKRCDDPIVDLARDLDNLEKRLGTASSRLDYDTDDALLDALEDDVAGLEKRARRASGYHPAPMEKVGHMSTSFEKRLQDCHDLDGLTGCAALAKARRSVSRVEFQNYQAALPQTQQPSVAKAAPVREFEALVKQIARDEKVPMHVAMSKARAEYPDEFASYQAA